MHSRFRLDSPSAAALAPGRSVAPSAARPAFGPADIAMLAELPPFLDRATIAAVARVRFGIIASIRSIERWPLQVRHLNGYATVKTSDVLAYLAKMTEDAARIPGGRARRAAP